MPEVNNNPALFDDKAGLFLNKAGLSLNKAGLLSNPFFLILVKNLV